MKLSKVLKKKWVLIILGIILIPFWLFILGGFSIFKLYKSKIDNNVKYFLIFVTFICTLVFGKSWSDIFLADDDQPQAKITQNQETQDSIENNASYVANENDKEQETQVNSEKLATNTPTLKTETITVSRVIDGDTIELSTGEKVRYIGIDTPETKHPSVDLECYGQEASDKNKELVLGKEIRLEKDVSETDKYGRLLRYVYIGNIFVNDYLVRQGFAQASSYPPDIKYQEQLREAEKEARENNRGLWSEVCDKTPIVTTETQAKPVSQPTTTETTQAPIQPQTGGYTCDCNKLCGQMSSCEEAYFQLNQCGCSKRDGNNDGIPCESICN